MAAKFYVCEHCGNLVGMIHASGVPMICCGQKMTALEPNTVEASNEKHLPVATVEEGKLTVKVGSVAHPMADVHYIQWIYVQTDKGGMRRELKPNEAPEAVFTLGEEKPVAMYAYCNLHGLWMTQL